MNTLTRLSGIRAISIAIMAGLSLATSSAFARGGELTTSLDSGTILLGDAVTLTVQLPTFDDDSRRVPKSADLGTGQLRVEIAKKGQDFELYTAPGWGVVDTLPETEDVQDTQDPITFSIFYNVAPETSHLSPLYRERAAKGRVAPGYAFGAPGTYQLRVRWTDDISGEVWVSSPQTLSVRGLAQGDLVAWEALNEPPSLILLHGDCAGFSRSQGSVQKGLEILEAVAQEHPRSRYQSTITSCIETLTP